ncbi:MAG: restriction endonuclease, partial [Anaerolineae bacterium]|nr:restriction endonuclease [Anaerolineae bacterium]
MPVPSYVQFIEPLLRYLASHPDGVRTRDAHEAAADALNLSPADRTEMLTSGMQAVYKNRTGWAHDRLKRAGYSACPKRGIWHLTETGVAFERGHPQPLSAD